MAGAGRVSGKGLALHAVGGVLCAGHFPAVQCHREGMHSPGSPARSERASSAGSCSPALQKALEAGGVTAVPAAGLCCSSATFTGAAALGAARNGGAQLGTEVGLQRGGSLTGLPQGCVLAGPHTDGYCPPGQPSSGRCWVCAEGPQLWRGWEPSCLFAQEPVAMEEVRGPGDVRAWRGGVWVGGPCPAPC